MPESGKLTKARFVEALIECNGYTPKKSQKTIEIILEFIKSSLENGEDLLISGFCFDKAIN
jgi:nucleoid DNA-binding protein